MSAGSRTRPADAARLRAAPRCGARTRRGTPCRSPAVRGRARCRMHGGARGAHGSGSGAPPGNRNAVKDGFHTAEARAWRRTMDAFIAEMEAAVAKLEAVAKIEAAKIEAVAMAPGRHPSRRA